jgi:hypothetical protein
MHSGGMMLLSPSFRRKHKRNLYNIALLFLLTCCFVTLLVNFLHGSMISSLSYSSTHQHLMLDSIHHAKNAPTKQQQQRQKSAPLAGLDCTAHGGPADAQEMVYWSDIPSDNAHVSPFYSSHFYLTFEPDGGGWNNIRMSMETVLAMAHAMGRTLVLPPKQRMYLLHGNSQQATFDFADFYPMEQIAEEQHGLQVLSMQEFLTIALRGTFQDATGNTVFPPHNRTDWNGASGAELKLLNDWLHEIAIMPDWNPNECLAAFASSRNASDLQLLQDLQNYLTINQTHFLDANLYETYVGNPVATDASPKDRLLENLAQRTKLCIYDATLQKAPLLHFHGNSKLGGRLLVHFYAFLFFQDWRHDVWMKRFVRDHVRYVNEIQCAAARIVQAVRQHARALHNNHNNNNEEGVFDSFHIRRGDFQYKATRIPAIQIYNISKNVIPEGSTVYIGTDERDKTFFDDLRKHYNVLFLDDFLHLVPGMNPSYFGMLDQLVASRGRHFFGCWFSTFSSYVNRLRGYHSQKNREKGYEQGIIDSYYYAMPEKKLLMREFWPVKKAFHAREFPRSWMNIDAGIE